MSKKANTTNKIGRPLVTPPAGRITLQQAAEQTGVSYTTIYRYCAAGFIKHAQAENGTITIPRSAVPLIKKRATAHASTAEKHAIMLRPDRKRYAEWAKAAGGKRLSSWIAGLVDRAAARAA